MNLPFPVAPLLMALLAAPAFAQNCPQPDVLEDNDTCATALPLLQGTFSQLNCDARGVDPDFYAVRVPAGHVLSTTAFFTRTAVNDIDIAVYEGCGSAPTVFGASSSDQQSAEYVNDTGLDQIVTLEFFNTAATCTNYFMDILVQFPGPCPGDDVYEPNDDCSSAAPIQAGALYGLSARFQNRDHYRVLVPPGETATVTVAGYNDLAFLVLELFAPNCGSFVAGDVSTNDPTTGISTVVLRWTNTGSNAAPLVARVFQQDIACMNYALEVNFGCALDQDDPFEDNDTCAQARPLPMGETADLRVRSLPGGVRDDDFWTIPVSVDRNVLAAIDFEQPFHSVRAELYDASVAGCGDPNSASLLAVSEQTATGLVLRWGNNSAVTVNTVLRVTAPAAFNASRCVRYDMVAGLGGDSTQGAFVCTGFPSSLGFPAYCYAWGSRRASDNDVTLAASNLPYDSFGYFLTSRGFGIVNQPGGSLGTLCIAGAPIGRFNRPGEILNSGTNGFVTLPVDLTDFPSPTGTVEVLGGQNWFFQYWFRDSLVGAPVSNFTGALMVSFE